MTIVSHKTIVVAPRLLDGCPVLAALPADVEFVDGLDTGMVRIKNYIQRVDNVTVYHSLFNISFDRHFSIPLQAHIKGASAVIYIDDDDRRAARNLKRIARICAAYTINKPCPCPDTRVIYINIGDGAEVKSHEKHFSDQHYVRYFQVRRDTADNFLKEEIFGSASVYEGFALPFPQSECVIQAITDSLDHHKELGASVGVQDLLTDVKQRLRPSGNGTADHVESAFFIALELLANQGRARRLSDLIALNFTRYEEIAGAVISHLLKGRHPRIAGFACSPLEELKATIHSTDLWNDEERLLAAILDEMERVGLIYRADDGDQTLVFFKVSPTITLVPKRELSNIIESSLLNSDKKQEIIALLSSGSDTLAATRHHNLVKGWIEAALAKPLRLTRANMNGAKFAYRHGKLEISFFVLYIPDKEHQYQSTCIVFWVFGKQLLGWTENSEGKLWGTEATKMGAIRRARDFAMVVFPSLSKLGTAHRGARQLLTALSQMFGAHTAYLPVAWGDLCIEHVPRKKTITRLAWVIRRFLRETAILSIFLAIRSELLLRGLHLPWNPSPPSDCEPGFGTRGRGPRLSPG